jgi:hypothetical protein
VLVGVAILENQILFLILLIFPNARAQSAELSQAVFRKTIYGVAVSFLKLSINKLHTIQ